MKPHFTFAAGILGFLVSMTSQAGALGTIVIDGNGCTLENGEQKISPIAGQPGRYKIPLQVAINKKADSSLVRKNCNFRLPVNLERNQKVVVSNVSQWVRLGASEGTQVKTNLEVFLAGSRGNPLTTQIKAIDKAARLFQTVRAEGIVAESECGVSSTIAGNLSALANGPSRATAALGFLQLTIKIVRCD